MFDVIRFRYKLARLRKQLRDIDKLVARKSAELRKKNAKLQEIQDAERELSWPETEIIYDQIHKLHTDYLLSIASRLIVPTPSWDDQTCWEESPMGFRYLTTKGIADLRAAIRSEQKLRLERILMWVPAIAALTGLIGALTGFIAIWHRGAS